MCWYSSVKHCNGKPKVATEDIIVYKLVKEVRFTKNHCESLYTHFCYEKDKSNEVIPLRPTTGILFGIDNFGIYYQITEGYHSYASIDALKSRESRCEGNIAEFIIPQGYEYFINEHGELVSSNIIFKSIHGFKYLWL